MDQNLSQDNKDSQQIGLQQNNYVTLVPVEYPRNRIYCNQNSEYMVDQYRNHDDYVQSDLSNSPGTLYSVSQRIPNVTTSYSNLCGNDVTYVEDQNSYRSISSDWERERIIQDNSDITKETNLDVLRNNEANTASIPSSILSVTPPSLVGLNSTGQLQNSVIPIAVYLHNHTALMMDIEDVTSANCESICQVIINCEELGLNKQLASQVFTLWMTSPLLELQLKPSHRPYEVRQNWRGLVQHYSHASYNRQDRDESKLLFQRNIFFSQQNEEKIKDQKILELLYEEARYNILEGRYPCEVSHYIMLGGLQARIELGPYNPQVHSIHYFREEQSKYLPVHVRKSPTWAWLPISSKNSAEVRLLEQFKRIPNTATNRKLIKKYLEFCWSLPFYGSAFFEGQIEQPVRGLTSLITHQDIPVLIAINSKGVYVIDDIQYSVLLGLKFEELSWEYARPSREDDINSLPCLFLQFMVVENGARVSKILQIFSRQASLMDSLITDFVNQMKLKSNDEIDKTYEHQLNNDIEISSSFISSTTTFPSLTNKLSKLTLATFDEEGRCIGQMGSWSFSY